jgi:hypothetical protein
VVAEQVEKYPIFCGTRKSLPCLQEHVTGPFSVPVECSPYHNFLFPYNLIQYSHVCQGLSSGLFIAGFPTKILFHHLSSECCMHSPADSP